MKYVLSANAQKSLIQIKAYTAETFGNKQAKSYLKNLQQQFELLCKNPELGIARNDIKTGYRCRFIASHTIYYRIRNETIGQRALLSVVSDDDVETYLALESAHDRALFVFLRAPQAFRHAEDIRYADEYRKGRMWDGFLGPTLLKLSTMMFQSSALFACSIPLTFSNKKPFGIKCFRYWQ